jgi:DNA-binding response OmpR family regulator
MIDRNPLLPELLKLRQENDDLRYEIREIRQQETVNRIIDIMQDTFRCQPLEAKIISLLAVTPGTLTKETILSRLYQDDDGWPEAKIIDVTICKIRKRLAPLGIKVETMWSRGYRMAPACRAKIKALLAAEEVPTPAVISISEQRLDA